MQIQQVNQIELGLLIAGIRSIYIADCEPARLKLAIQLENEMSTRFDMMVGTLDEQERNKEKA